ncbi:MAG TPA: alpha-glucosidase C-terminal domain-containing protein, partial [Bacillales bacterium]|nr:alpha-glucosidase C-terminal domain-containing protein [Bacillales bacterium]
ARTPMQWNDEEHGGFTTGEPWIKANADYKHVNVAEQRGNPDSILNFYKKLISLRKTQEVIVYGRYELLAKDDENVYAFTRSLGGEKLLVACNFSDQASRFQWPDGLSPGKGKLLVTNERTADESGRAKQVLKPYEAFVYLFQS